MSLFWRQVEVCACEVRPGMVHAPGEELPWPHDDPLVSATLMAELDETA